MLSSSPVESSHRTEGSTLGGAWILSPCSGSGREFSPYSSKDRKRKHLQGAGLTLGVTLTRELQMLAGLGRG